MIAHTPRQFLETLYHDALTALQPGFAVRASLESLWSGRTDAITLHIIGLGKAAPAMCHAALAWCAERAWITVANGLCITHAEGTADLAPMRVMLGDHPTPGERSLTAAAALGDYVREQVQHGEQVLVLLSGGTSALIGAPRGTMTLAAFAATSDALLGAGLSINQINRQRRQLSRWGGGRLGAALLACGAHVEVLAVSDVLGDDLASIGSGPCIVEPDEPALPIPHHVIGNNRTAREVVRTLASERGVPATVIDEPLYGDVSICAERITLMLLTLSSQARSANVHSSRLVCWGGEPTVMLSGSDAPPGGRMQALALALARRLHDAGHDARGITILAAGTDGRDGNTDAAGAVIDAQTLAHMRDVGRSPEHDAEVFRSHDALASVSALIPAFASGTNVNDIVIALLAREMR